MSLILKSIFGLAFLMLGMSSALFIAIGSFHFWQGWVFLGVIGVCSILITSYMLKFNRNIISEIMRGTYSKEIQKKQQILFFLACLCFIGMIVVPGLDHRFEWSHVPLVVSLIADRLLVVAFYIIYLTFRENKLKNKIVEGTVEQKVITSGPYRLVRHPMYTGAFLLFLFAPLALASWVVLPISLLLIAIIMLQALEEEKFLQTSMSGYSEYRQKVRYRLIPFIW